jgi:SagB-type dehydrogenase family enzyme
MTKGIGREFMKKTRYRYMEMSDQNQGLPQPPLVLDYDATRPRIDLPAPDALQVPKVDLRALMEGRRSVRAYAGQPLSLAELSYLLWCTQGVEEVTSRPSTRRPVPSAGARHAFETLVLANRVEGLRPGLYWFLALEHRLAEYDMGPDIADRLTEAMLKQAMVRNSAATFLWMAVAYRMMWRYGERGYRYMHIDAGHVCQNLYLAAESIGCGVCAVGAFEDEQINDLLGLDGVEQFVIYTATVGKKP